MSHGPIAHGLRAQTDRAVLVALGRAGKSWEYVPAGLAWLRDQPADSDIRVLLAASYGRLGLRTAGEEALAALAPHAARTPAAMAVRAMLAALGDDRAGLADLAGRAQANARALHQAGADDATRAAVSDAAAWWARTDLQVFRTAEGATVARDAAGEWVRWGDPKSAVDRGMGEVPAAVSGAAAAAPVYLDGLEHPGVARRLCGALERGPDGAWPAVVIVEEDVEALAWALGTMELGALLAQERTYLFAGPGAARRFEAWLMGRLDLALAGRIVLGGSGCGVGGAVERALAGQADAMTAARGVIESVYSPGAANGAPSWSERFSAALAGRAGPLRVLIPTTRFSTFLRHSVNDLAGALERAGCRVRILEEPTDHWRLSALAGARAVADWRPDVVVSLNWPRSALGPGTPANVPFVMFVQDAMPHLFTRQTGRSLGELDYILGHLYGQWFLDFDYPRARTMQCPVLVSSEKFHPGPVEPALARAHACEIAYVSHQSETPEACRDRLIAQARSGGGALAGVIEELWPRIVSMTETALTCWDHPAMVEAASGAIERVTGGPAEPGAVMVTVNSVIKVIGDRLLRHRTLGWAAAICARRGWRLHIYGRGWEKHRTLAPHARGELAHGEALRATYRSAAVHLHASSGWMLHQRVMECAMSGGLPLVRLKREDVQALVGYTESAVGARVAAHPELDPGSGHRADIADHAEGLALAAQLQRIGLEPARTVFVERDVPTKPWLAWEGSGPDARGMPYEAAWLLGDWSQTTFTSEAQLEALVERAAACPAWRAELSGGIAARVRRRFTYDAVAARLLAFMARTLPGAVA